MKTTNLVDAKTGIHIWKISMETLDAFIETRKLDADTPSSLDMALALRALLEERRWQKAQIMAKVFANGITTLTMREASTFAEEILVSCGL